MAVGDTVAQYLAALLAGTKQFSGASSAQLDADVAAMDSFFQQYAKPDKVCKLPMAACSVQACAEHSQALLLDIYILPGGRHAHAHRRSFGQCVSDRDVEDCCCLEATVRSQVFHDRWRS